MSDPAPRPQTRMYATFRMWIPEGNYSILEIELLLERMRHERMIACHTLAQQQVAVVEGQPT